MMLTESCSAWLHKNLPARLRVKRAGYEAEVVAEGVEEQMTKYKLEYLWLDGYKPVPNLRGKTQIKEFEPPKPGSAA
jgi:hypothetical protein